MKRVRYVLLIVVALSSGYLGCKKVIEVRPTVTEEVVNCSSVENLFGRWISDSVHITTEVDTIDSLIINRQPTLTYFMVNDCSSDTLFFLFYETFAGVRTERVRSTNFSVQLNGAFVFDPFVQTSDTSEASFVLRFQPDSTNQFMRAWFIDRPNPHQVTRTDIFFRKETLN